MEDKIFDKNITDSQRLDMIKIIMSTDGLYGILEAFEKEFNVHFLEENSNKVEISTAPENTISNNNKDTPNNMYNNIKDVSNSISSNIKDTSIYDKAALPLVEEDMKNHPIKETRKIYSEVNESTKEVKSPVLQRKIPNPYMDSKTVTPNE